MPAFSIVPLAAVKVRLCSGDLAKTQRKVKESSELNFDQWNREFYRDEKVVKRLISRDSLKLMANSQWLMLPTDTYDSSNWPFAS